MNIFKHEFKMHLRSVMIWSISITVLIFLYLSAFSAIGEETELINEMMDNFPPELMIAFGMDNMDWGTVLGFFPVVFLFVQVCLAIQAANYGFSLVSIEERELTADFLMAKPISRTKILTSKLLAVITSLTITNIVVWISSFLAIDLVRDGAEYDSKALIMVLGTIVVFQLFFLSFGMLISLLVKRVRAVTPYSMALAFGMYVLSAFGGMLGDASLEVISPFKHFEPNYILANLEYDTPLVIANLTVIVLSIVGSYLLYARRNIASAV